MSAIGSSGFCSSLQCNTCLNDIDGNKAEEFTYRSKRPLKCGSCSLVWYCGHEHQKADWKNHRDICKAVKIILMKANIKHPLELMGDIKCRYDLGDGIRALKIMLSHELKRELTYFENQLTTFVAYCAVCYSRDNMKPCEDCYAVAYCSKEHAKMHAKQHKPKECNLLSIYYSPLRMRKVKPELKIDQFQIVDSLKGMDLYGAFEKATKMKLPVKPTESMQTFQLFNTGADFSCIATICFVMEYLDMKEYRNPKFVIYIIGATIELDLWFQLSHVKFFFSQYPQLSDLQLYFIGPNAVDKPQRDLHFDLHGVMRHVFFKSYNLGFADFMMAHSGNPSLMFSFNSGFSDYETMPDALQPNSSKIWSPALKEILRTYNVPFVFTSVTEMEAKFNYAEVLKAGQEADSGKPVQVKRIFACGKNPHRDFRPLRNMRFNDKEDIFYRNNYLQAVISSVMN